MERTTVLTAESHLLRGESAAEPLGRVTGGTVQLADGRTVAADEDLVRLLNVLLSSGLAHRRAQLVVDSEYVSAQTAAVMLGVSRPTVYKWQDNGLLGLEQVGNRRRVPLDDIAALLLARGIRSASDEVLTEFVSGTRCWQASTPSAPRGPKGRRSSKGSHHQQECGTCMPGIRTAVSLGTTRTRTLCSCSLSHRITIASS